MSWDVNLEGETALVVGGTRNIGLCIAEALQSAGAGVCVVGGSDETALGEALEHLAATGVPATGLIADISDETAVAAAFDKCDQELGPASIVINGPGYRPHGPFADIDLDTWNAVIAVMLTGPFLTSRELFRRLPDMHVPAGVAPAYPPSSFVRGFLHLPVEFTPET